MSKVLVVLDLNGTILDSTHHRRPGVADDGMARKKFVYFRPGMKEFLHRLFSHPNISVAVWTSNIAPNAYAVLESAMTPEQRQQLAFIFTREHCLLGPNFSSKKQMQKVYALGYKRERTIIVDDSEDKVEPPDTPGWIRVPEFVASPLSCSKDSELERLWATIEAVVSS